MQREWKCVVMSVMVNLWLIGMLMQCLINPGLEAFIPDGVFPTWRLLVRCSGASPLGRSVDGCGHAE